MFKELDELIHQSHRTVVLTGAGISTLSGIPDFRSSGALYSQKFGSIPVEEIVSIDFFNDHPDVFYSWAAPYWYRLEEFEPNIVHTTLKQLEDEGLIRGVFTQNIDMLHFKAGSKRCWELHGSAQHNHCTLCGAQYSYEEVTGRGEASGVVGNAALGEVPRCKCGGVIKPDIVLYGEPLDSRVLEEAQNEFSKADLCIVLGSSLVVNPAASLPLITLRSGGKLVIVNKQSTPLDGYAVIHITDLLTAFS